MTVILWDSTNVEDRKMLGTFETDAEAEEFKKHVSPRMTAQLQKPITVTWVDEVCSDEIINFLNSEDRNNERS
jgi:hypothetical protein